MDSGLKVEASKLSLIRIRVREADDGYTLEAISVLFEQFGALLTVASMNDLASVIGSQPDAKVIYLADVWGSHYTLRQRINDASRVVKVTYNSPIEFVMSFPGEIVPLTIGAFAAARGLIRLVERWQKMRVTVQTANLQVAVLKFMQDALAGRNVDDQLLKDAAAALLSIEDVENTQSEDQARKSPNEKD